MNKLQFSMAAAVVIISLIGQSLVRAGLSQVNSFARQHSLGLFQIVGDALTNARFLTGFCMLCASALTYMVLLYTTEISRAFPAMSAMALITLFVIARFWLKEEIGITQWVGVGCLVVGTFLIAR